MGSGTKNTNTSFKPLLCTVEWDDPKSTHDCYTLDDVVQGKGAGLQRNRQTVGYLCYINEEYLELYSDWDEQDREVGGGTAIILSLVKRIKRANGKVMYVAN
jgi:hypothetical protein